MSSQLKWHCCCLFVCLFVFPSTLLWDVYSSNMLPSIVTVHAFTPSVKMALLLFVCLFFQAHYCGIFIQVTYFHPSLQCMHSLPHSHFSLHNTVLFLSLLFQFLIVYPCLSCPHFMAFLDIWVPVICIPFHPNALCAGLSTPLSLLFFS